MKKKLFMLLVVAVSSHAAENALELSPEIIEFGNQIVKHTIEKVQKERTVPLTGSVYESYLHLYEDGFQGMVANNTTAVSKALEYLTALSNKASEHEFVSQAISAFEAASSLPKDAEQEAHVVAWVHELKLAFEALKAVAKKDLSEDFSTDAVSTELILLNNGQIFSPECIAAFEGGLLASLAGYEKRKQAMGDELLFQAVREAVYPSSTN